MPRSYPPRLSFTTKKGNDMLFVFMLVLTVNGEMEVVDYNLSGQDCIERMIYFQKENLSCHFQKETE